METISSGVDLLKLMKFGRILSRFQKLAAEKIGKVESQSSLNTLPLFRLGDSATQRCFNSRDTKVLAWVVSPAAFRFRRMTLAFPINCISYSDFGEFHGRLGILFKIGC
ncbi:uncharacterized protein LOC131594126 isoform X1 [Vicia villosa]|uniref:uncharacterized protein LOC131594126 isoform X1 n=1 Tax=Vicia villosa TaxID=3911 RepID=UPI00273C9F9D|nr:uncharacterized protein LOC131594126 isoform X1 [Vicia villosa]XP_058722204.1 uncharacterized protein LOC131594126 isoform X1 [Vicia villosa]XP_058722205.1 uncharacterized protein LOC131594126 isoform X1 [Vicia villosa]